MTQKPLVAVIGRPNVGKSTFFNRIVGKRIAIIEDTPGVTRDRIYADAEWLGRVFTLIDTGGIEPASEEPILKQMRIQAQIAIDTADVILFMVDAKEGIHPADWDVAQMLRHTDKPVLLVVNKVDHFPTDAHFEFYSMGMGDPIPISSTQMLGLGDLLDDVVASFPMNEGEMEEEGVIHVAVVGKPNAGKSSLVNALLGEQRVIVSDVPGTTRDAIDTPFSVNGQDYLIIDTAGIRRKARIEAESVERYSVIRALAAIRRCDVALIVLDAEQGVTEQDTKIAGFVHEEGKAAVIIVNKWDLIEKDTHTMAQFRKRMAEDLKFLDYAPTLFISAKSGQRVPRVLELAKAVYDHASQRITTGVLNEVLGDAIRVNEPPVRGGRRLKIFYSTQVSVRPPTVLLFVNEPELMHYSYERYLENHLRKSFDLEGTPIRIRLRSRDKKDAQVGPKA